MLTIVGASWISLAAVGAAAFVSDLDSAARAAIQKAVVERMGDGARVTLEGLDIRAGEDAAVAALRAVPPPGARTGRRVPFALFVGTKRVGVATAIVRVALAHVRVSSPVERDAAVTATDTALAIGVVDGVRFERLPGPAELVGARVRRSVAAGEPLTQTSVQLEAAVRSGDEVEVVARVGSVEARGVGRVSGRGHVGDWVRVARPGMKGLQSARVVAPGVVELKTQTVALAGARGNR